MQNLIDSMDKATNLSLLDSFRAKDFVAGFHYRGGRKVNQPRHDRPCALLLDLDNTLTDTRAWFADFILPATALVADQLNHDKKLVNSLFADIAKATTLHEYAFAVESIAFKLSAHRILSQNHIAEVAHLFWQAFARAHSTIALYPGVLETLNSIRSQFPETTIIILTDSPEWVAIERLQLTGVLPLVDGVVAIRSEQPRLRCKAYNDTLHLSRKRIEKIIAEIDTDHLRLQMAIPAAYAKPSSAGIELIASRLDQSIKQIVIVGDKDSKEGQAAQHWRQQESRVAGSSRSIDFVRADYGNHDLDHPRYVELAKHIPSLKSTRTAPLEVPLAASLKDFSELPSALERILNSRSRADRGFLAG